MAEWMTSLGIDLGTSTTKLIVSRLQITPVSQPFGFPEYRITNRELVYCSDIHTTPLLGTDEIDYGRIVMLLEEEYRRGDIQLTDIKSGAVIITGETAGKRNAEPIVHHLAERAGDFVVAAAGAELEGILAGRGSGAEARSLISSETVLNIDVGGGTANAAYFRRGSCIAALTLRIGGRLIRVNKSGVIQEIAASFAPWLAAEGYSIRCGEQVDFTVLQDIASRMAACLLSAISSWSGGRGIDPAALLLNIGEAAAEGPPFGELMISGGIAALMTQKAPQSVEETAVYGDIGPLLAHAIMREAERRQLICIPPEQTVRATVIGAGMHTTELSGATVYITPGVLPIRNLPVVKIPLTEGLLADAAAAELHLSEHMKLAHRLYGAHTSSPCAFALTGLGYCSYTAMQHLADAITDAYLKNDPEHSAVVIICSNDMAKALGQALAFRMDDAASIICIDQINVKHGDYIDVGEPLSGDLIPVIIKTLAFLSGG
ncbi:ethanolamine ammonia-lyase reactivating factor EutA [Paenibacillus solisilvae]|uniref:Ethanolamine ammonia-lyase reactivating factor EutA n=1 Tax=Paenibacillus solisilvae TaxID=2486751 RepID=A0ABW0VVR1_9BACL